MSKQLVVKGTDINSEERITGTGINFIDGRAYLYNKYVWYEVDPNNVRVYGLPDLESYPDPKTNEDDASVLQERIMQTVIEVCKERNLTDIDEISFGADGLQDSIEYGSWTPSTDSSLNIIGRHDGKRKIICEKK